jgi:tetratricopeptide (TPR) repeat protein
MEETSGDAQEIEKIAERYRSTLAESESVEVLAEAHYRLGLYELIQARKIERATHHFQESAGLKDPYWSLAARTSLAICLYRQGKTQKALFEFRRVGFSEVVNEHSINALLMMGRLLRDDGEKDESQRAFDEGLKRIKGCLKQPGEGRKDWLILGLAFASECDAHAELESWAAQLEEFSPDELPAAVRHQLEAIASHG